MVELAPQHDGRLPEHFGPDWAPDLDLNRDRPDDPFKPYGATIGHGLEWSRLLLHVEADPRRPTRPPGCSTPRACSSTVRSPTAGTVDGAPGFVYTTDWDGTPVVRQRMHWVVAEAIAAAAALHRRTGEEGYAARYAEWWRYVVDHVRDTEHGLVAPRARPGQPAAGIGVAGQARPLPRGPGDAAPAAAAGARSRACGGPVGTGTSTGMMDP